MSQPELEIAGLLVVDKESRINSARVVDRVKRFLPRSTKVGHAGTLDPFATGVLILLLGSATRRCEQVMAWRKTYEATLRLGATTLTDDPESPERLTELVEPTAKDAIVAALAHFIGPIQQRPPVYSAIKIAGRRACDRARDGAEIEMQARTVHVHSINLLDYAWPLLKVRIECGRGTYIRSIARDLGAALGVGAYLTQLRRTRIGDYGVEHAVCLEELSSSNIAQHVISPPW
jgi:tRNA pseudouridine55 synthase